MAAMSESKGCCSSGKGESKNKRKHADNGTTSPSVADSIGSFKRRRLNPGCTSKIAKDIERGNSRSCPMKILNGKHSSYLTPLLVPDAAALLATSTNAGLVKAEIMSVTASTTTTADTTTIPVRKEENNEYDSVQQQGMAVKHKVDFSFDANAPITTATTISASQEKPSVAATTAPILPNLSPPTTSTHTLNSRVNKYVGTPTLPCSSEKEEKEFIFSPTKRLVADHVTDEVDYELGLEESTEPNDGESKRRTVVRFPLNLQSPSLVNRIINKEEKMKRKKMESTSFPKGKNGAISCISRPTAPTALKLTKSLPIPPAVSRNTIAKCAMSNTAMNNSPKPKETREEAKKITASKSGWGDTFASLSKPGEWKCNTCYIRNPHDASKCLSCEEPKSGASTTTAATSSFVFATTRDASANSSIAASSDDKKAKGGIESLFGDADFELHSAMIGPSGFTFCTS